MILLFVWLNKTHFLLGQYLRPSLKGSCHQPTNTTPVSPGAQNACRDRDRDRSRQENKCVSTHTKTETCITAKSAAPTCPGEIFSGTPSSTETLSPSMSKTQRTGQLLLTSASPQSSWKTNCSPCRNRRAKAVHFKGPYQCH